MTLDWKLSGYRWIAAVRVGRFQEPLLCAVGAAPPHRRSVGALNLDHGALLDEGESESVEAGQRVCVEALRAIARDIREAVGD